MSRLELPPPRTGAAPFLPHLPAEQGHVPCPFPARVVGSCCGINRWYILNIKIIFLSAVLTDLGVAVPVFPSWGASAVVGVASPPGTPQPSLCTPKWGYCYRYLCLVAAETCSGWRGLTGCCRDPQPWLRRGGAVMARGTAVPHRLGSCPQVMIHLLQK